MQKLQRVARQTTVTMEKHILNTSLIQHIFC
jgi:hypothetical protein